MEAPGEVNLIGDKDHEGSLKHPTEWKHDLQTLYLTLQVGDESFEGC